PPTPYPSPLSLHDALPIFHGGLLRDLERLGSRGGAVQHHLDLVIAHGPAARLDDVELGAGLGLRRDAPILVLDDLAVLERPSHRSEEHTSELQSRFDLVCR